MTKPESPMVPQLGRKLSLLYAHGHEVRNASDLATWMKVKTSTVSGWVNGIKGKPGGRVRPEILDALSVLLAKEIGGGLSNAEARLLWLGPMESFKVALLRQAEKSLLDVLKRSGMRLTVRQIIHDPSALGMIEDAVELPEGTVSLGGKCQLAFEIDGKIGFMLAVLVEEPAGWRVLGPGPRHSGRITERPERFPNIGPATVSFRPPYGAHRFVFLEVPTTLAPMIPTAGGIAALPPEALSGLAAQLALPASLGKWRWAEAVFDVKGA